MPAVQISGVTKDFGPVHAVRGIDLTLEHGEIVAFLGPNGAGKTTTIDMVLGLSHPTTGSVEVLGLQPRQAIARGLVSAVMQTGGLLKDLSVRETVQPTPPACSPTPRPSTRSSAPPASSAIADRKVGKCSGGEQQRLRFAMALLSDPALLLLDEPTTGMDVEGRRAFWSAIRSDAEKGRTVLFATHYLEEADQYADRIVLISHGRIVADGTGSQIKALAAGRTVRATLPGADSAPARRAGRGRERRRTRRRRLHPRQGHRRSRALPAHRDHRARPRDHRPRPRGRVPQPHRRRPRHHPDHDRHTRPRSLGMTTQTIDPTTRRVPPLGGFNLTVLGIELRRMLRNRRTIIFTLILPAALLLSFGGQKGWDDKSGSGNVAAYILISMALYGAALTAAAGGSMVALERSLGWSRQLRLTPLNPVVYIVMKALVALVMGALAITAVNLVGILQGKAEMPTYVWILTPLLTLACTLTFAALGVFIGYVVPGENAMQILGPGLALLSFLGGVFIPLDQYSDVVRHIAYWTPMYGVAEIARSLLTQELPWYAVVNAVGWFAIFVAGAAWRMSKDTARV